jgi:hypothetical protein
MFVWVCLYVSECMHVLEVYEVQVVLGLWGQRLRERLQQVRDKTRGLWRTEKAPCATA